MKSLRNPARILFSSAIGAGICLTASARQATRTSALEPGLEARPSVRSEPHETVAGGEVFYAPVVDASDEVPRPERAVVRVEEDHDIRVRGKEGDPFFLGFAGGRHYPAESERLDPALIERVQALPSEARGTDEVYAFVMFGKKIDDARRGQLRSMGARILGFHPHHSLKVALPTHAIENVSELPFVRWVGLARPEQKVHPILARQLAEADRETFEVFVNLFDSDLGEGAVRRIEAPGVEANAGGVDTIPAAAPKPARSFSHSGGWQEARLIEGGMEIDYYQDEVRSFRGRMTRSQIEDLLREDWVLFIEPWLEPTLAHDESTPLISADWGRAGWDGGTNGEAVVGEVDSGIRVTHFDLNHIYGIGWNQSGSASNAWVDGLGHGTHVAGTIFGNGDVEEGHTGNAPGLGGAEDRRIFNVKVFDDNGAWGGTTMSDILDVLNDDYVGSTTTPKPHVINHSWRTTGGPFFGTENDARLLDSYIHIFQQQHVFAAGNEGSAAGTIGLQPSAKNVLTIGNVRDHYQAATPDPLEPGLIWSTSSRGPCADGRWKPNVVAPGSRVTSADSSSSSAYMTRTGTSMAAPHAVGLAAQLVDKFSFLRYNPPTLRAVLMASALTWHNEVLTTPDNSAGSHLNTYGTGKLNAVRAHGSNWQQDLYFWRLNFSSSNYGYVDLPIDPGATQVTFVMTYSEVAGSAGASTALVNDMDMYIDRAPFSAGGNTGEYFAQQSTIDNTEVRILTNPQATDYRIKIYPEFYAGGFLNTVQVGICAIVTYGDTTPPTTFQTLVDDYYVQPGDHVVVTGAATNPEYIQPGVYVRPTFDGATLHVAETTLADGVVTNLLNNDAGGMAVTLGDIHHAQTRAARWDVSWATEGAKTVQLRFNGSNITQTNHTTTVRVDGTPPSGPTNLASSTHQVGVPSCRTLATGTWSPASDTISGLNGYNVAWNADPNHVGAQTITHPNTAHSDDEILGEGLWYLHVRAVDRSGNWGATQHFGPIEIVGSSVTNYCSANPNSTGFPALIGSIGSTSIAFNDFVLTVTNLPPNQPSLFFYGPGQTDVPFGNGRLCVNGLIVRLPVVYTGNGSILFPLDYPSLPPNGQITSGSSWNFQNWYRDPQGGGPAYNLTGGLRVTFCD